jgi:hypothetical protein
MSWIIGWEYLDQMMTSRMALLIIRLLGWMSSHRLITPFYYLSIGYFNLAANAFCSCLFCFCAQVSSYDEAIDAIINESLPV